MRVLWFSNISPKQDESGKFFYPGGNWILSLKELLENEKQIDLGIVFYGEKDIFYTDGFGTKYYQLSKLHFNKLNRFVNSWKHKIESQDQIVGLLRTINDFQPDIIHIFGSEGIFGQIIRNTSIPVVIHIQGIINPYLNAWNIPKFNLTKLLKSQNWIYFAKGAGLFHDYYRFRKMAKRELSIFKSCKYFMGRTNWDKAIAKLYSPKAEYFHCDEVIRDCFYNKTWEIPQNKVFTIASTINANIYKGLDLILNSANLLKSNSKIEFEWHVYGVTENSEYARFIQNIIGKRFVQNNIVLKGTTLSEELLNGLMKSDLFVHCSYIDNSPNSVCEAQLIGLPVISTNVGGISSLIEHAVDGFLVPSNEPHILVATIIDLYEHPEMRKSIGQNGISSAKKRHDRIKIKKDLFNIYSKIINRI